MTAMQGPTPQVHKDKKTRQQMVSREDLLRAIQKMQLPQSSTPADLQTPNHQQMNPSYVLGANG